MELEGTWLVLKVPKNMFGKSQQKHLWFMTWLLKILSHRVVSSFSQELFFSAEVIYYIIDRIHVF